MSELEEKLASVMNDPDMMQKIMSLAQSLGGPQQEEACQETPKQEMPIPDLDLGMLQKLSGFAQKSGIDHNQKTLLHALVPYISQRRVSKLERAMRAAKMAGFATNLIGR